MLNNKGFSLIELLASLVIITIIMFIIVSFSRNTFRINKNKAYMIMKENIYKASQNYVEECESKTLSCDLNWTNNKTEFNVHKLHDAGFFKSLNSPIDGKDLSNCLIIEAYKKENKVLEINIIDKCY